MEMHNSEASKKRRRKIVSKGPVLVRSVKPGNAITAVYEKENKSSYASFWKD